MPNTAVGPFWCVSVNPAIDKRMHIARLTPGEVNRASEVRAEPGGKAAHVAMVLRTLGADPLWIGFAGGSTGEQLLTGLRDLEIRVQPVMVNAETRVNLEIIDREGGVTEILEPGSAIAEKEWERFVATCEESWCERESHGTVIGSGSLPPEADPSFYRRLTELAHQHGHKMCLDTSGEPMRLALAVGPDFVKPNREEAELLVGESIQDYKSAQKAALRLVQLGAKSAVVSLGGQGFVWQVAAGQDAYYAQPVNVKAKSTVGCGDATMAAFAYAMAAQLDMENTLRLAAACGAANCLADAPGRLREADVRKLETKVRIKKLD
jgi:1-phosphofructokinase family hexose kinase